MKYKTFFRYIIQSINSSNGEIYTKKILIKKLNIKPHNIQKIIREFNSAYPNYAIQYTNTGYYAPTKIPQEIIDSLPGFSSIDISIAFIQNQILKSIFNNNYTCPSHGTVGTFIVYKSSIEKFLEFYGIPSLDTILSSTIENKIYLLANLPTYTFLDSTFEKKIFFLDNTIYNLTDLNTFNHIKALSSKYANDILIVLGNNYKTSLNYYILFFYFLHEFIIYIHTNNNILNNFKEKENLIFEYFKFSIPNFCNFNILKNLLILELHIQPQTTLTLEENFIKRFDSLSFYPLFGVFIPNNHELIISTYSMYIKLISKIPASLINSYTINKLVLLHLVVFRKSLSFNPTFSIPIIDDFNGTYEIIYKCFFKNENIAICKDVSEPYYLVKPNETVLLIPKINTNTLINFNSYSMFPNTVISSLKKFDLNYICSSNEINTFKVRERLLFNFPNANIKFYNDLCENLPKKNYVTQLADDHPITSMDDKGNFSYRSIIKIIN